MSHMVRVTPSMTKTAQIRHVRVSLPLIECLVDGVRYFKADAPLPPVGGGRPSMQPPPSAPRRPNWAALSAATTFDELEQLLGAN
jgi:hypothetical protein